MSQFKVISNDEANSLCASDDEFDYAPFNYDWHLAMKQDNTFHLYWYLPLSQRDYAIRQWRQCQDAINKHIGSRPITTVSWADEPLHPINDCSRFYNPDMTLLHQPLGQGNSCFSNKALYRFLLPHVSKPQLAAIYKAESNSFTFTKDEYNILQQLHSQRDGMSKDVAYAADIIIVTLMADNDAVVTLVN